MSKPLQRALLEELQTLAGELDTVSRTYSISARAGSTDPADATTYATLTLAEIAEIKAAPRSKPQALLQRAEAIAERRRSSSPAGKQVALPL